MIDEEIYGIIPRANIAILLTAPPAKTLNIPSRPFWLPSIITFNCSGSIPGKGTNVPNLYTARIAIEKIILWNDLDKKTKNTKKICEKQIIDYLND